MTDKIKYSLKTNFTYAVSVIFQMIQLSLNKSNVESSDFLKTTQQQNFDNMFFNNLAFLNRRCLVKIIHKSSKKIHRRYDFNKTLKI